MTRDRRDHFTECRAMPALAFDDRGPCRLGKGHLGPHFDNKGRDWTDVERVHAANSPSAAAKRPDEDRDREGRVVARRVSHWHIGDPDWADLIINAYLNPTTHQKQLEQEMKDND